MARKLRIQYEGALYHVINRGNYRRDLFETAGAAQAFVTALEETTLAYGWRVHAYAVMRNHFHIVLETPQPNLVEGMHWLQSTLATRFNRYRSEQGHLFQGRYHSGLIEDIKYLAHVVDYVHLNPVSAGIIQMDQAASFRWSSLGRFVHGPRFRGMVAEEWLTNMGLNDNPDGWATYLHHLTELAGNLEEQKRLGWDGFSYGWALGSDSWRRDLAKDHATSKLNPGLERATILELREMRWNELLEHELTRLGRKESDLSSERLGAAWKVQLALHLRTEHGISLRWLSQKLHLGAQSSARSLLCRAKKIRNQHSAA